MKRSVSEPGLTLKLCQPSASTTGDHFDKTSIHPTVHSADHQAGPPFAQSHVIFHPVLDPALISCRLVLLFQHLSPPAVCLRTFYLVVSCLHSDPDPVKQYK